MATHPTLYTSGRYLYGRDGKKISIRGINYPLLDDWSFPAKDALAEIAQTGANALRIQWYINYGSPDRPSYSLTDLDNFLLRCATAGMIPILMLSTSAWPDEVRESYQVHANSYVQKPTTLERAARLVRAIESFWIDFAISPGPRVASPNGEARSRAKSMYESATKETVASRSVGCADHRRLLDEFGAAVQELLSLHDQQFHATVQGDSECNRFDLLIHMANEKKQLAKYAYMRHLESHGCSNFNVLNETRT